MTDPLAQYMGDSENLPAADKAEAEGPPPRLLEILSFEDLRDLKPASPLVDGLIYHDTLAQLSGAPGCGKSFVAIGMACAVALRETSWEGHKIRNAGNVLYVAAEGVNGLRLRASAYARSVGRQPDELNGKLFVVRGPAQMKSEPEMNELIDAIQDHNIVLVIFDTRHRCTTGLDENSSTEQGTAITAVERVRAVTGVTALVIHHTGKGATASPRGSTAWSGAVWSDLLVTKTDLQLKIKCSKHKDVEDGCEHLMDLKRVTVEPEDLPNASEQQRTTLVATTANENGLTASMLTGTEDRIVRLLDECAGQEGLSTSQILKFLEERGEEAGQTQVYAAVKSLQKANKIRAVNPEAKRGMRFTTEPVLGE